MKKAGCTALFYDLQNASNEIYLEQTRLFLQRKGSRDISKTENRIRELEEFQAAIRADYEAKVKKIPLNEGEFPERVVPMKNRQAKKSAGHHVSV